MQVFIDAMLSVREAFFFEKAPWPNKTVTTRDTRTRRPTTRHRNSAAGRVKASMNEATRHGRSREPFSLNDSGDER